MAQDRLTLPERRLTDLANLLDPEAQRFPSEQLSRFTSSD